MPNHQDIYAHQADMYEQLISKQASLIETIQAILPVERLDIIDLGAGSGRLTCTLAPLAKSILALDASEAMLHLAAERLQAAGYRNWRTQVADHRKLPVEDACTDFVVSGWSICYLTNSQMVDWKENLEQVIREMQRVLRPGGTIMIIENYGTGFETPHPPDFLLDYYEMLQAKYGFNHTWIRTDYTFESVEEAEMLTRFFFGDIIADQVVREKMKHVPECAGVWWMRV